MKRKHFFEKHADLKIDGIVSNPPVNMFPQETDWTCSIACVRTLLSGVVEKVPSEEELVKKYEMTPGPYYSKDMKKRGMFSEYDIIYGCDHPDAEFEYVLELMKDGYHVMLECMYNYAHWFVLLGYYPLAGGELEKSSLLIYDPYYDNVRLLNADEFLAMWIDGDYINSQVKKDFVAIREGDNSEL